MLRQAHMNLKLNLHRGILVSPSDIHLLEAYLFHITTHGYVKASIRGKMTYIHRLIYPEYEFIDHINRNKADNRRENLREASRRDNRNNQDKPSTNNTGYKGVTKNKDGTCYSARITVKGKRIGLGSYLTKEEAAIAYNKAAIKYQGKFACLNVLI